MVAAGYGIMADVSVVVVEEVVVRPSAAAVLSDELIDLARAAAVEEAGAESGVGDYLGARSEDDVATSAAFAATDRGYRGWYWSVTLAVVDPAQPTISEVVLLPGRAGPARAGLGALGPADPRR